MRPQLIEKHMTPLIENLYLALNQAEEAFYASGRAMRTHGHQAITWAMASYDARRVQRLRRLLDWATRREKARGEPNV